MQLRTHRGQRDTEWSHARLLGPWVLLTAGLCTSSQTFTSSSSLVSISTAACFTGAFDCPKMAPFPLPPPSLMPRNPICKSPPFLEILNPLLSTWSLQWFYASLALKITNFRQPLCWIFSTMGCEILIGILKMHSVMPACPWTWCCSLLSPRNGGGGGGGDRDDDGGGVGSDDDDGGGW